MGVLLVNCGISPRRFAEHAPERTRFCGYDEENTFLLSDYSNDKPDDAHMMWIDSVRGDLASMSLAIREMIIQCNIRAIVLSGWEWASSTWRRRERLLFFLKEIMAEFSCTIVVYAQSGTNPVAGSYDRGGIGRLAQLAVAIADIRGVELAAELAPSVAPTILSEAEWFEIQRRAQLEPNKFNDLTNRKPRAPRVVIRGTSQTGGVQNQLVN
jgi:hypothetical protein